MGLAADAPGGGPLTVDRFILRGVRVLTGGGVAPADVGVDAGRVTAVAGHGELGDAPVVDAGDSVVFPGLVDAHVHVNEPGRTDWEGYATAGAAAVAGGVTTLVDMPLNGLPPALDAAAVRARVAALTGVARADVAVWGGLTGPDVSGLAALADAGVAGVKVFMSPSGVEEFAHVGERELDAALPALRDLGLPLLAHAEHPAVLARAAAAATGDPRSYATWLASRPVAAETEAIDVLVRLCAKHRARVHVVHVTSAAGAARVAAARAAGLPFSGETCPHYLTFAAADVPAGATEYKCAPPIRDAAEREALRAALRAGDLALVASDHSPCPPELKARETGDFGRAWGGIASLQLLLPATWTALAEAGASLADLGRWLAEAPAELAGLAARKGRIVPGADADFTLWDPDAAFTVEPARLFHRHRVTPYAGRVLRGVVQRTWLRGRLAYDRDRGPLDPPAGTFLPVGRRPTPAHP